MGAIRITYAVPLSGSILLIIIKSQAKGKNDACLLATSCEDALLPGYIESLEQTLLWPDDIQPGEDDVEVTIEIEDGLFDKTERWCAEVGISVEQLALAFIRFCACTDNHAVLKEWFSPSRLLVELESTVEELQHVRAELLEIKQRFGIDKQEAFLEANANITLKEFAAMLHGRDCQPNLTPEELLLAKDKGFVVVYGDSDDRVEFEGAIRAEGYTNPLTKDSPAGVLVLSDKGALLDEDSDLYAEYVKENRNMITVYYCRRGDPNWVFETDIPHETFLTYDGGYDEEFAEFDDGVARCIVFEFSALKVPSHSDESVNEMVVLPD